MLRLIENKDFRPYFNPVYFNATEDQIVKLFNVVIKNSVPKTMIDKYFNHKTAFNKEKLHKLKAETPRDFGSQCLEITWILDIQLAFYIEFYENDRYAITGFENNARLYSKYPTVHRLLYAAGIRTLREV